MYKRQEYIYVHTTAELKEIFGGNFPDYTDSDFYEMDIGTAGLMRSYMAVSYTHLDVYKRQPSHPARD